MVYPIFICIFVVQLFASLKQLKEIRTSLRVYTSEAVYSFFGVCYFNIMIEKEKGCVYFFKHVGLSPVKIGFSTHESPLNRFEQFRTYAPFGAELIGFIRTYEPIELESILHAKHSSKRLKGEWFELSIEQVEKDIDFYSNIADVEEMNNFQIEWSKNIERKKEFVVFDGDISKTIEHKVKTHGDFNVSELAKHLNVSRQYVHRIIKKHKQNCQINQQNNKK